MAVSGHGTVKTCVRLGGAVDFINNVKEAYRGPKAFDDHTTARHSISSPLPDQLKGAWFCITKKIFYEKTNNDGTVKGSDGKEKVPKFCIDVDEKGRDKIKENLNKKLYDTFAYVRYTMLDKMS